MTPDLDDFDKSLGDVRRGAAEESAELGDRHCGIEHLLLFLARHGVAGVDLPYDQIKRKWLEMMGRTWDG